MYQTTIDAAPAVQPPVSISARLGAVAVMAGLCVAVGVLVSVAVAIGWGWGAVASIARPLWLAVFAVAALPPARLAVTLWRTLADTRPPVAVYAPVSKRQAEPLFVGRVEPARQLSPPETYTTYSRDVVIDDAEKRRKRLQLCRDMVELGEVRGLAIRSWASRQSPSGVYVSQSDWRAAVGVLLACGAIEQGGRGYGYHLTDDPSAILAQLGLHSAAAEAATGEIIASGRAARQLVRV